MVNKFKEDQTEKEHQTQKIMEKVRLAEVQLIDS